MSQKLLLRFNYAVCKKDISILISFLTTFEWLIRLTFSEFYFIFGHVICLIQTKNDLILYYITL